MIADELTPPEVPGYRLRDVLGEGATSVVWSATGATGRAVAVKVPRDGAAAAASVAGLEAYVHAAVRHDHLVPLRDVVALPGGGTALVFDLVEGASLRTVVDTRGRLRPGEVVTILTPICQAVAALHAAAGTHGDISPGNIMLTRTGRPLLLDLGAAQVMGERGDVYGTVGFVAPEVREGGRPTSASDVFSLGAVAWFCLTGNGAPDTSQRLDRETIASHVGDDLTDVIAACIDPAPGRRPDAARLAGAIYEAARREPVEVVVGGDEASALTHRLRAEAALQPPAPAGRPGHGRRRLVVTAALTAMFLAVAGWLLLGRGSAWAEEQVAVPHGSGAAVSGAPVVAPRPADVQRDASAPRTRTLELMQWLSDRRARVLVGGEASDLTTIHQPGSASYRSDAELLRVLAEGRNSYADLQLEVAVAWWVKGDDGSATVRARVDWSGYVVVAASGERTSRPPAQGNLLDFALLRDAAGWRIAGISVPPST